MKTTVVCGLLGSGKTTFIKNRLASVRERTVVLVNDFGAAGIDGEIFSAGGIEAVELPSGCVCCSLKFDLITTIDRIVREFAPEHLMIEPSGVASPSGVLEALGSAGGSDVSVVGIVDVTEFSDLYQSDMYGNFFEDQIVHSDVILVNKADLAGEGKIVEAMGLIGSINPQAILLPSVNSGVSAFPAATRLSSPKSCCGVSERIRSFSSLRIEIPPELAPGSFNAEPGQHLPAEEKDGVRPGSRRSTNASENHFHFETLSFRLREETRLTQFSLFFEELAKGRYGSVARAKALIRTGQASYRFDLVFGKIDSVPFERNVDDSRIVIIGQSLDSRELQQAVKRMSA